MGFLSLCQVEKQARAKARQVKGKSVKVNGESEVEGEDK